MEEFTEDEMIRIKEKPEGERHCAKKKDTFQYVIIRKEPRLGGEDEV